MTSDTMARFVWRRAAPEVLRARINAARARRHEAAWRRPRRLGDLRRTAPFSTWGSSRGVSIDRVYVAGFIESHADDVRGRVLEIAGDEYVTLYGRGVEPVWLDFLDGGYAPERTAEVVADAAHRSQLLPLGIQSPRSRKLSKILLHEALHGGEAYAWLPQ